MPASRKWLEARPTHAAARLIDRGVIRVSGEDARDFLQNLVTNDMDTVTPERAGYGALLTPQGKIISDFLVVAVPEARWRRLPARRAAPAGARSDETTETLQAARQGGARRSQRGQRRHRLDRRLGLCRTMPASSMPIRACRRSASAPSPIATMSRASRRGDADAYHARRIALGVPDGGRDFAYGDTFPHEALLDQLGGVSFRKGCYIGQEVVSRMQHRGTARTRIVPVVFTEGLEPGERRRGHGRRKGARARSAPAPMAAASPCSVSTVSRTRWRPATPLEGGGLAFTLAKPGFIRFPFPGEPDFGAAA